MSQKLPLRLVIFLPFVLNVCVGIALVAYLSWNGQRVVNEANAELRNNVTQRINDHLENFIRNPEILNRLNSDIASMPDFPIDDISKLDKHLWRQIQIFDSVAYIQFGTENGEFIGVERQESGEINIEIANKTNNFFLNSYSTDNKGNLVKLIEKTPGYDSRKRPWYIPVAKSRTKAWSELYVYFDGDKTAISVGAPLYDFKNKFIGVTAVDLSVKKIDKFLQELDMATEGQAFIIDRQGFLIATSTNEKTFLLQGYDLKRLQGAESINTLTKTATKYLKSKFIDLTDIRKTEQLSFVFNGRNQLAQVTPFQNNEGLYWLIVVVIPEADFTEQIQANINTVSITFLFALVIAISLGIFISRRLTEPILSLSKASKAFAEEKIVEEVPDSEIEEISILTNSFKSMVKQLRNSHTSLEQQVFDRTHELRIAKEAAEEASKAKSNFLANMSHELRTPLNAILGFAQLLVRDVNLTPKQKESLETINRSGEHLLRLINNVLDMAKIEAGRAVAQEDTFNLHEMLHTLQQMLGVKSREKYLYLNFEIPTDLPLIITTDREKLSQILINLIGNGIKFTKVGGVTVKSMYKNDKNSQLFFEVIDTGIGLDKKEKAKLFQRFEQTDSSKKVSEGTGLGLALSKQFALLLGGDIDVDSEKGKGSRFSFYINIKLGKNYQIKNCNNQRVSGLAPQQPDYRLLVVDDNIDNRNILLELLQRVGFDVKTATNGQEAIYMWQEYKPHLIWMDIQMPVMDGFEATRYIKANSQNYPIKIIAITAGVLEQEKEKVMAAGCDDFVGKPFQEGTIFDKLSVHLGTRYIYENISYQNGNSEQNLSLQLTVEDLQSLSTEWLEACHQAATKLQHKQLVFLMEQIPPSQAKVAEALKILIKKVRFDNIQELTSQALKR